MVVLNPSKYMDLLPTEIRSAIDKVVQVLEESFTGIWMPDKLLNATYHYIRNRGKLIRPTLALLMAYSLSNGNGLDRAVLPAASIELVHMASLLQDDIMDQQRIRRGVETPYSIYGPHMAMLASDLMIAKAVECATRSGDNDIVFELINSSIKLAIGQSLEMELANKGGITIDDYLRLIYYKTASLIESSMVVGAYSVDVKDGDVIGRIRDIGRFVGIAFQVRDDIIDFLNMDSENPGGGPNEVNIVRIMSREGGHAEGAIDKARKLLNEMLDNAIGAIRKVVNDDILINYINLLRI